MSARCLLPRALGDSSEAAELFMATTAVKEAMAHRIQAGELRQVAHSPSRLCLDSTTVLHWKAPEKVTRGMKYLTAKLAIVQDAKAVEKIGMVKMSSAFHYAGILTKRLQGGRLPL